MPEKKKKSTGVQSGCSFPFPRPWAAHGIEVYNAGIEVYNAWPVWHQAAERHHPLTGTKVWTTCPESSRICTVTESNPRLLIASLMSKCCTTVPVKIQRWTLAAFTNVFLIVRWQTVNVIQHRCRQKSPHKASLDCTKLIFNHRPAADSIADAHDTPDALTVHQSTDGTDGCPLLFFSPFTAPS